MRIGVNAGSLSEKILNKYKEPCSDAMVEDVHFRSSHGYESVGWKSIVSNQSDLAGMGAFASAFTISLGINSDFSDKDISLLYKGMNDACESYGGYLVGGDVVNSEKIFISISAIGELYKKNSNIYKNIQWNNSTETDIKKKMASKNGHFILGIENRLEQVIANLLSNALRYTDEGYIKVKLSRRDNEIVFSIIDTGIGITPKALKRIFERFYRTDKARDRQKGGTGLGLSIAKHIIEAHGSKIYVDTVEGKGSTFSFGVTTINPEQ